jgi:hypothetical protein
MSQGLLRDMILSTHMVLRMLQSLEKNDTTQLYAKRKKRKQSKKKAKAAVHVPTPAEQGHAPTEGGAAPAPTEGGAAAATPGSEGGATGAATAATPATPTVVDGGIDNLFDSDNDDDADADADADNIKYMDGNEFAFDFKDYESKFADWKVVRTYAEVLQNYMHNGKEVNHAIVKMYHRVFDSEHCNMRWLFYQLSLFQLFDKILNDPDAKREEFAELRGFLKKAVVANFFRDAEKYPPLFAEVLFWKDADAVNAIDLGPTKAQLMKRKSGPKWTDESSKALRALFTEHHEADDALEKITEALQDNPELDCQDRTEASVRSKLNHMKLYLTPAARWYGARFSTDPCTRGCDWIPRLLA